MTDKEKIADLESELSTEYNSKMEVQRERDVLAGRLAAVEADLAALRAVAEAAKKWPRCCDLWQDSMGGMHCTECGQKTFAMMREIQILLGIDKGGNALAALAKEKQK